MEQFTGYRRLWAAVMIQAFRDLKDHDRVTRDRALHWIHDESPVGEGGFKWICTCLDLDKDYLRASSYSRDRINLIIYGKRKTTDMI
jgi:hypothetical protein